MTLELFMKDYGNHSFDFAYYDGNLSIGIFPAGGRKVICCDSPDSDGIVFDTIEDALDKFMVNGRPFRDVLPDINENLL